MIKIPEINDMGSVPSKRVSCYYLAEDEYGSHLNSYLLPPLTAIVKQYIGDLWRQEYKDEAPAHVGEHNSVIKYREFYNGVLESVEFGPAHNRQIIYPAMQHRAKRIKIRKSLFHNDYDIFRYHTGFSNPSNGWEVISCCDRISIYDLRSGQLVAGGEICHMIAGETVVINSIPPRCFTIIKDGRRVGILVNDIIGEWLQRVDLIYVEKSVQLVATDKTLTIAQ